MLHRLIFFSEKVKHAHFFNVDFNFEKVITLKYFLLDNLYLFDSFTCSCSVCVIFNVIILFY